MSQLVEVRAGTGMGESALRLTMAVDYLTSSLGRFSLMPVLAILLASQSESGSGAATTGVGMFGFMLFAGLSSLLVTKWLPRLPYRVTMTGSMVFSAVGFGLLPYSRTPVPTMALLLVAGFGISVHAALARVLIPEVARTETGRNNIYSIQQIATNAAAAVGPFIAGALYVSGDGRPLLTVVGLAYLVAGVSLLAGLPRGLRPPDTVRERSRGLAGAIHMLRDPECRRATVITALGTFAYAQFYSAFALLVALAIDSALLRGVLLAGPPIFIVFLQALVTALTNRYLRAGVPPLRLLVLATLVFGVSMVFLGIGLPVAVGATIAMTIFAVAEMLFTPAVSVTFNRITSVSRLAASNLQGAAWTSGEAFGSLCGGAVFLVCYQQGVNGLYWLALAAAAIAGALPLLARSRNPATTSTGRPS